MANRFTMAVASAVAACAFFSASTVVFAAKDQGFCEAEYYPQGNNCTIVFGMCAQPYAPVAYPRACACTCALAKHGRRK